LEAKVTSAKRDLNYTFKYFVTYKTVFIIRYSFQSLSRRGGLLARVRISHKVICKEAAPFCIFARIKSAVIAVAVLYSHV